VLWPYLRSTNLMERFIREIRRGTKVRGQAEGLSCPQVSQRGSGLQAPLPGVGEARREVGGAKAQGVLGGEGGVGEDASRAVCPPYTNAYTYILTRPGSLHPLFFHLPGVGDEWRTKESTKESNVEKREPQEWPGVLELGLRS
jgi:hypothetical protein